MIDETCDCIETAVNYMKRKNLLESEDRTFNTTKEVDEFFEKKTGKELKVVDKPLWV